MSIRSLMWEKHEVNPATIVRGALCLVLLLVAAAALSQEPAAQPPASAQPWPSSSAARVAAHSSPVGSTPRASCKRAVARRRLRDASAWHHLEIPEAVFTRAFAADVTFVIRCN